MQGLSTIVAQMAVEAYKLQMRSLRWIYSGSGRNATTLYGLSSGQLSFAAKVGVKPTLSREAEAGLIKLILFLN